MHGKTMREALQEARDYRDDTNEGGPGSGPQKGGKKQSSADIKKAYGILNDPRYKQGNYSGAAKAIDKLSPGLSNHPDVKNAMKRANEESQITEKKAEFLRLDFKNKNEVEKLEGWMYKFISQVNAPYDSVVFNKHRLDGFSVEFEGMDDADALMTKLKKAGFRFKVDMRENSDLSATGDTTTSNASQELDEIVDTTEGFDMGNIRPRDSMGNRLRLDKYPKRKVPIIKVPSIPVPTMNYVGSKTEGGPGSGPQKTNFKPLSKNHSSARATVSPSKAREIKKFLSDNGEKYPVAINDNGSGQITIDDDGEKGSSFAAGQAIAKKFGVKVMGEGNINEVKEASFSKGQMDALVKGFGPLGDSERNKIKMDKVAGILKKLPKDALMQLSKANLPMVSKVAKEML